MMGDRIAAAILRRLARNANVSRLDAGEPEPRLGALAAIAFGRAGGEVEVNLETQRPAMAAALMSAFHGACAVTIMWSRPSTAREELLGRIDVERPALFKELA